MAIYQKGKHTQKVTFVDGEIQDITCDCMWGTLHSDNYQAGEKVCRHIKEIIKKHANNN